MVEEVRAYKVGRTIYEDRKKADIADIENQLMKVFGDKRGAYEVIEWLAKSADSRKLLIKVLLAVDGGDSD